MSDYKLVCWNGFAIPVEEKYKWMAMDETGSWYVYENRPAVLEYISIWKDQSATAQHIIAGKNFAPEPGPWTEQLYWIGD